MERHRQRLRFPLPLPLPFPRLLAAAVVVECCARLCSSLSSEPGSTLGTAIPCTLLGTAMGQRCQTDPEQGAGTEQALTPEAVGHLQTEAELLAFPGTLARTVKHPRLQGSPGGPWAVREGTRPTDQDGTATEHPGLSTGTAELAAVDSERPAPAQAPLEPETAPATGSAPGTDPGENVMAESATTPQGSPSHSPPSATVPGSAGGQWGSSSTLPGWSPTGTELVQRQGGSHSHSSPEPWTGEGLGATIPVGDSSSGSHPSIAHATDDPAPGTVGTLPFVSMLSPTGTLQGTQQGLPDPAREQGPGSRPWHGANVAWEGPHPAPHTSLPPLGASGREDTLAQPAAETGPTLLPAAGKGLDLPVPTTTTGTSGVTSRGPGGDLYPPTGVLETTNTEDSLEHSHVPPDQTRHPPAVPRWPPASVTLGSTTVAQSRMPYSSSGSPQVPTSLQPALASSSAAPMSLTPEASLGTSRGVPGLSLTAGTSLTGPSLEHQLPHTGSVGDPAESPQILGESSVGVSDVVSWATTAPSRWQPGSLAPILAPESPKHPAPSQPVSSLGSTTVIATTTSSTIIAPITATTTTITATTASPALLRDIGVVTPELSAAVLRGDVAGLTWGPPSHLPTTVPGPPQQPTDITGTLGYGGGLESSPGSEAADLAQPSSRWQDADTSRATLAPVAAGRAPRVFIVEDQPPLLRASLLRIPFELVLDMGFIPALQDPESRERQGLLHSFNQTVTPLFMSVPGFLRLEVTGIRKGSVVLEYDALFVAERVQLPGLGTLLDTALGSGGSQPGLVVGTAPVLRNVALEWPLDPCAVLFSCRAGFACVTGVDGNATCTSLCHQDYCKNHGICTHPPDQGPLCQCPVGSDFWFMGLRCDYRVTQQSLLGMAVGILLSIVLLAAVVTAIAIHRFKVLLLEARADQTRSSYRRFCRLDDISGQYWSRSWLPSASSLDNPAFSNSEELLHLQILDNGCCSCGEDSVGATDCAKQQHSALPTRPPCQPSFHYDWDTSSSSMNDPMVDSGKASDISVSSWPMEPLQWTPFPLLHQLSRQRPHKARRPYSYCEGMELVNLERSWTA